YWEEQASIYKMNPFDLFNLILKSKFNLSDKNFTEENDFLLIKSVKEGKKWLEIGITIGKHPLLCIKRYIKLNQNKNNWTQLEDKILLKTVEKEKDWIKISMALENKTLEQCKDRYKKIVKVYNKGKWTKEEDEILKDVCAKYQDKNWVFISTFI
ncbi:Myb-related protein 3R-1, partial [Nosema bombycis CQ1]